MSELSLGLTDYGALGVLGGTTPIVSGFGLRPRVAARLNDGWRFLLTAPVLFYPAHARAGAWWLTRPSISLDATPNEVLHLALGAGVVAVATHQSLFGDDSESDFAGSPYGASSNGNRRDSWWTLNLLASHSLSERSHAFLDATAVMSDLKLAGSDWIAGPPFVVLLGLGTQL